MAKKSSLSDNAAEALKHFDEIVPAHKAWVAKVERRYNAYRGVMDRRSEAAQWTSKLAPPFVNHIIETTSASLTEDTLSFRVIPRARLYNEGEWQGVRDGAKAHELLLREQMAADRFDEKQRWFILQNQIAGLSVAKVYWRNSGRMKKRLKVTSIDQLDEYGNSAGSYPELEETSEHDVVYDGPCVEIVDVRDFFWDDASISLDSCPLVCHRVWKTKEECKRQQALGRWSNVDQLGESRGKSSGEQSYASSSGMLYGADTTDRTKNRIEILEIWQREDDGIHVYVIGNRSVCLAEYMNPYWHGEYPFVTCATQSDLFRIDGMSQVEKIADLQEALWTISNQRLDNLSFLNNAVVIKNPSDDMEFEIFPGAVNEAEDPAAVQLWQPNSTPAEISLPAESMLQKTMQDLAGGFPFTSTSEARTVGADTATEASLVASLGQRSLLATKTTINYAFKRIGQQMLELNQQFVREPVYVNVLGIDSEAEIKEIVPEMLAGSYGFDIQPMNDSLLRNERRAEAQTLFTALSQQAQVMAMTGAPLNMKEVAKDFLDSWDVADPDRYFSSQPQQGQAPQQPSQNGQQQQQGNGVTAPQASGPMSPSNEMTQNPAAMMQQFLAAQGGGRNT